MLFFFGRDLALIWKISLAKFEVHCVKGLREITRRNFGSVEPFREKNRLRIQFCFFFFFFYFAPKLLFSRIHTCFLCGKHCPVHFFCWFALRFPEKWAKNVVGPICHCYKLHVRISMRKMNREIPAKQNTENIINLEALRISGISTTLQEMAHNSQHRPFSHPK